MSDFSRWQQKSFINNTFPPHMLVFPAISGTGTVGQTLTATPGSWTYAPTSYAYQWMRNNATPVGTNASTYTLVAGDSGNRMTCVVTATNAAGSTVSAPSDPIRCA
jgi:hypothetical protein